MTHTYAVLEVDPRTFEDVELRLRQAQYEHAIDYTPDGKILDMHGIGLKGPPPTNGLPPKLQSNLVEKCMVEALNEVKAWRDSGESSYPFPQSTREKVDVAIMLYEARRK